MCFFLNPIIRLFLQGHGRLANGTLVLSAGRLLAPFQQPQRTETGRGVEDKSSLFRGMLLTIIYPMVKKELP